MLVQTFRTDLPSQLLWINISSTQSYSQPVYSIICVSFLCCCKLWHCTVPPLKDRRTTRRHWLYEIVHAYTYKFALTHDLLWEKGPLAYGAWYFIMIMSDLLSKCLAVRTLRYLHTLHDPYLVSRASPASASYASARIYPRHATIHVDDPVPIDFTGRFFSADSHVVSVCHGE